MNIVSSTRQTVTSTLVPDAQRAHFWPGHFGTVPQWVLLELRTFNWMGMLCADYAGGIWAFHTLSNGGAFMAPETDSDDPWTLFNDMNGNGTDMSPEAAGIAACLMAYSHHASCTESQAMIEHFYRLREYALHHPESQAIFYLID